MSNVTAPIASIRVCVDCMLGNVNEGETLDYVVNGGRFPCDTTPDFDSNTEEGMTDFDTTRCEGCGSDLAGARYRFAVWAWL